MCGICGIVAKKPDAPFGNLTEATRAMTRAMRHRGPDDEGFHVDERKGVALGHSRLSIIDLSTAGRQPLHNNENTIHAVVNGEIYNYRELRDGLAAKGHRFVSDSDSEVVPHLFEEHGSTAWEKLRGMYACAVYDEVSGALVLARDPLGIKPLYLYEDESVIAFASEIRAFRALDPRPEPSIEGIMDFLLQGCIPAPATHLKRVKALQPGEVVTVRNGALRRSRLATIADWCPPAARAQTPDVAELGHCLRDSVRRHLVSDAPIGLFLSGGIDSGTLAGIASQVADSDVRAVSVVVPGHAMDESAYARQTADAYGIGLTEIPLSQNDFETDLALFLSHLDLPSIDGFNTFVVSKAARQAGLTVALSGVGGDELFAGYPTFRWVPFYTMVRKCLGVAGPPGRHAAASLLGLLTRSSGADRVAEVIRTVGADRRAAFLAFRGLFVGRILEQLVAPDLQRHVPAALERFMDATEWCRDKRIPSDLAVGGLEIQNYMGPVLLRDTDALSMAHSLEVRTPLVDVEVVKAALPFLAHPARGDGYPKWPLRNALQNPLPEAVVQRKKQGFSFPWQEWMSGKVQSEFNEALREPGEWAQIIRPDAARRWQQAYTSGHAHWRCFWSLYVLMRLLSPTG